MTMMTNLLISHENLDRLSAIELDELKRKIDAEFYNAENRKINLNKKALYVGAKVRVDCNAARCGKLSAIYHSGTSDYKYGVIEKIKIVNCEVRFFDGTLNRCVPIKSIRLCSLNLIKMNGTYECPICYKNKFSWMLQYPCGHFKCIDCSESWSSRCILKKKKESCAMCRREI